MPKIADEEHPPIDYHTWEFCRPANLETNSTTPYVNLCFWHQEYYLELDQGESGFPFVQKAGTWILIFTNLVPISLMVSKEIVALFQGNFMSYDLDMYDKE